MSRKLTVLAVLGLVVAAAAPVARADVVNYYVALTADGGSDSNSGSSASPFATVQKVLATIYGTFSGTNGSVPSVPSGSTFNIYMEQTTSTSFAGANNNYGGSYGWWNVTNYTGTVNFLGGYDATTWSNVAGAKTSIVAGTGVALDLTHFNTQPSGLYLGFTDMSVTGATSAVASGLGNSASKLGTELTATRSTFISTGTADPVIKLNGGTMAIPGYNYVSNLANLDASVVKGGNIGVDFLQAATGYKNSELIATNSVITGQGGTNPIGAYILTYSN